MGYFSELDIDNRFPPRKELTSSHVKKTPRNSKLIEGQIGLIFFETDSNEVPEMPDIRKSPKTTEEPNKNIIKDVSDNDLPVKKEYLNQHKVEFLNPTSIPYIRKNILEIGRRGVLKDTDRICAKSDEDLVNSLVVIPRDTMHVEYFPKKHYFSHKYIYLTGAILALPLTEYDGTQPEQRYIYVGNFSPNEKIRTKASIGCKMQMVKRSDEIQEIIPFKMPWGTLRVGYNLPAYKDNAIRVQISITGKNDVLNKSE